MKITKQQIREMIRQRIEERCQKGYKTHPTRKTKVMFGRRYEEEGQNVPLGFPMYIEASPELYEAKKKKAKKKGPLGKPMRNTGSGKKYKVYMKDPKTGNIRTITYGDQKGGLEGNWNSAEARKSYAKRHRCAEKKDRMTAGYWACRAHKDFGKNVPGRFW